MLGLLSARSSRLSTRPQLFILSVLLLTPALCIAQPRKGVDEPSTKDAKPADGVAVDVRFTDNSVLKLVLREDRLEFMTQYGKLYIPAADIRRIEFGLRVPEDVAKKIESAIADLGNNNFKRREAASNILLGLREKAYPAVVKATKNSDMEISNRAEELVKKFKDVVPNELLQVREFDVIHTENSKIAGKLEANTLKANTIQFGEVSLRLADVFTMTAKGAEPEPDNSNVQAGPVNMVQYQNEIGKTFTFRVTGNVGGSVWGTDIYTTDTTLASAAVHTGLLTPGQTGVIKVTVVPSPNVFVGSTRNGVTSAGYAQYPAAYRVHK